MRSHKIIVTMSLSTILLSTAEVAAQPVFEFPIGASAGGEGTADGDALVQSVARFDPPLSRVGNDSDSLLAAKPITNIDHLFAVVQDTPLATAQLTAFCGAGSTAVSQVDATDDWQVIGYPFLIRFFSAGQAKHHIAGKSGCAQFLLHANRHLVSEQVDAPFLVRSAGPRATLVLTAIISASQTPGPGLRLVPAIGSTSGAWEIWNDDNRNHVIDETDWRIATHSMNIDLSDRLGPITFEVRISTSGAFVARFRARTRTSMTYRPQAARVYDSSSQVGTAFVTMIAVQ